MSDIRKAIPWVGAPSRFTDTAGEVDLLTLSLPGPRHQLVETIVGPEVDEAAEHVSLSVARAMLHDDKAITISRQNL